MTPEKDASDGAIRRPRRALRMVAALVVVLAAGMGGGWYYRSATLSAARVSLQRNELAKAKTLAERILAAFPFDAQARRIGAEVAFLQGEMPAAQSALEAIADRTPDEHRMLAIAAAESKDYARSAKAWGDYAAGDSLAEQEFEAHLAKLKSQKRKEELLDYCNSMSEAYTGQFVTAHRVVGDVLRKQQRFTEAAVAYSRVGDRIIHDSEWLMTRAVSLLECNRGAEAIGQLKNATDAESRWLLSRAYLQAGRIEEFKRLVPTLRTPSEGGIGPRKEPCGLTGVQSCAECHQARVDAQAKTHHANTFWPIASFHRAEISTAGWIKDPLHPEFEHRIGRDAGAWRAEARLDGNKVAELELFAVVGSGIHGVTMLGRDQDGKTLEYRMSLYRGGVWDLTSGHENLGGMGLPRDQLEVANCLRCHNSDIQLALGGAAKDRAHMGVRCESCHGPGHNHQLAARSNLLSVDPAILNPRRLDKHDAVALCAECHQPVPKFPNPLDRLAPRFPSVGFRESACFEKSTGYTCVTCHDPHGGKQKSTAQFDAACIKCHGALAALPCPKESEKSCTNCHMPRVSGLMRNTFFADHYVRKGNVTSRNVQTPPAE